MSRSPNRYNQFVLNTVLILAVAILCIPTGGCGPSYEEREARRKAEQQQAETELLKQISERIDFVRFPPKGMDEKVFTYELQNFFKQNAGRVVVFKGYIEDIEETESGILVEFTCPLGRFPFHEPVVAFHLKADSEQTNSLLNTSRTSTPSFLRSLRFLKEQPDYFVVAKVIKLSRARHYEFRGSTYGEDEVELSVETPPRFVATGELVDIFKPPTIGDQS